MLTSPSQNKVTLLERLFLQRKFGGYSYRRVAARRSGKLCRLIDFVHRQLVSLGASAVHIIFLYIVLVIRRIHIPGLGGAVVLWLSMLTMAAIQQSADQPLTQYSLGQAILVSCLNRTIDTGEHTTDAQGRLEYVPFPTCNETGRPLELYFGVEKGMQASTSAWVYNNRMQATSLLRCQLYHRFHFRSILAPLRILRSQRRAHDLPHPFPSARVVRQHSRHPVSGVSCNI